MDCIPPGSSVHGILQARTLEWVAILRKLESYIGKDKREQSLVEKDAGVTFCLCIFADWCLALVLPAFADVRAYYFTLFNFFVLCKHYIYLFSCTDVRAGP